MHNLSIGKENIFDFLCCILYRVRVVQWLAKKLAVSISVIRKLAVVFIPVEIQKFV